jgi:hypothetical protein
MEELRGLEEMNQLGLQYICAWMHHRETPCVAIFISNKQTHHIFPFIFNLFSCTKLENMKAGQVLPGDEVGWGVAQIMYVYIYIYTYIYM